MKRVSFKTTNALKEAGYKLTPAPSSFFTNETNSFWDETDEELYSFPYAIEVWFWLWRKKDIKIVVSPNCLCIWIGLKYVNLDSKLTNDPEEAIIAAIEYLVANNLIK